jgi:hypothetical protein
LTKSQLKKHLTEVSAGAALVVVVELRLGSGYVPIARLRMIIEEQIVKFVGYLWYDIEALLSVIGCGSMDRPIIT